MIRGESDEEEVRELRVAEDVAKRFVAWDISAAGGVGPFRDELARVLG
jgi:hypothetical protein